MNTDDLVAAVPLWVDSARYETDHNGDDTLVSRGICMLLHDTQTKLEEAGSSHYTRLALRVTTMDGVEQAAQFTATFDPSCQRFEAHHIRVIRDGAVVDHVKTRPLELMRRERDLERRVLNGHLTATMIIPDVRVGDIVEYSWTVHGGHKLLRDFYGRWIAMESASPVLSRRHRFLAPKPCKIQFKVFGALMDEQTADLDGWVDRRWHVERCIRAQPDSVSPQWQMLARSIQFSEADDWSSIARLFTPLYETDDVPEALRDEARQILEQHPADVEARVIAILRALQNRVRYLALALGEGGFVPRPPGEVWESGYGDCKDSTRLFVTFARLAGFEAVPALIATGFGPALDTFLPSATVFDHCIVRLRISDRTLWVDPTRRSFDKTFNEATRIWFGWALPLSVDSQLEQMTVPQPRLFVDANERVALGPKVSSPATIDLRIDYFAVHADNIHNALSKNGAATLTAHFLKRYQGLSKSVTEKKLLRIEEAPDEGRVSIFGSYVIENPWKKDDGGKAANQRVSFSIADRDLIGDLATLKPDEQRRNDIFLGPPRILRRRLEFNMPRPWDVSQSFDAEEAPGLRYKKSIVPVHSMQIVQEQELTINALTLPAAAAGDYDRIVRKIVERPLLSANSAVKGDTLVLGGGSRNSNARIAIYIIWMILVLLSVLAGAFH